MATREDELWALPDNPGTSATTVAVVQLKGQDVDFVAAVRSGSQRGGNSRRGTRDGNRGHGGGSAHKPEASKEAQLAAGMCFKHWRYGDAATSCTPPAAGRETAAPGATKRGRPRRTFAPVGRAVRLAVPGRHWRVLQHLPPSIFRASLRSRPEGTWRSDHPVLEGEAAASAVLRPPFCLDFSFGKSRISNSWRRFLKHFNLIVDLAASQLSATDTLQRFTAGPPAATDAAAQTRGGLFSAVESTQPLFRGSSTSFKTWPAPVALSLQSSTRRCTTSTPQGRRQRRASAA